MARRIARSEASPLSRRCTARCCTSSSSSSRSSVDVARKAAAKTNKKSSIVKTAPEHDEHEHAHDERPPIPAGRKSLNVIN